MKTRFVILAFFLASCDLIGVNTAEEIETVNCPSITDKTVGAVCNDGTQTKDYVNGCGSVGVKYYLCKP